jgi:peroxiredoxin
VQRSYPEPPPLPADLPIPIDDGAAAHLTGQAIPNLSLRSTEGRPVNLAGLASERLVLYVFPKIGRPGDADPVGWDEIPGARGCTQQSCAFRDLQREFAGLGYDVAGVSAQPPEEQAEAAARLHLPFPLLADPRHELGDALGLPTFEIAGMVLYKRLTLVARSSRVIRAFYPVFPPDENAEEVLEWLRSDRDGSPAGS